MAIMGASREAFPCRGEATAPAASEGGGPAPRGCAGTADPRGAGLAPGGGAPRGPGERPSARSSFAVPGAGGAGPPASRTARA